MRRALPVIAAFLVLAQALGVQAAPRPAASKAKITKSQIVTLMGGMDKAISRWDAEGVCAPLAKNVSIKISVAGRNLTFTRDQYKAYLAQCFAVMEGYGYSRKNTKISIARDGQSARVTADVYEVAVIQGRTIRTITPTVCLFKPEKGRTVITSMQGTGRLY